MGSWIFCKLLTNHLCMFYSFQVCFSVSYLVILVQCLFLIYFCCGISLACSSEHMCEIKWGFVFFLHCKSGALHKQFTPSAHLASCRWSKSPCWLQVSLSGGPSPSCMCVKAFFPLIQTVCVHAPLREHVDQRISWVWLDREERSKATQTCSKWCILTYSDP